MSRSSLMIDLDDPRTQKIADVMANATCKKILSLLAERELSESELAQELRSPLNTINYNMKKLVAAGLVETTRSLWSTKGRAVKVYRVSQKKIVISPRTLTKGVLPAFLVALLATLGIRATFLSQNVYSGDAQTASLAVEKSIGVSTAMIQSPEPFLSHAWLWFFIGAVVALGVLSIWNWLFR